VSLHNSSSAFGISGGSVRSSSRIASSRSPGKEMQSFHQVFTPEVSLPRPPGNRTGVIAPDRSFPNGSPVCEYWLSRCEGFTVRAGHRTLGVVQEVAHDGRRADTIVLRRGRRRRALPKGDVLAVVPARRVLLTRRHEHARPALRRAYAAARPVAMAAAEALWSLMLRLAETLRREVPRLTRLLLAEIHDRNVHHGAEPGVGRAHRKPNAYDYRLNTRGR